MTSLTWIEKKDLTFLVLSVKRLQRNVAESLHLIIIAENFNEANFMRTAVMQMDKSIPVKGSIPIQDIDAFIWNYYYIYRLVTILTQTHIS